VSSQLEVLGDGRKRICDRQNFDLSYLTVEACPDPRSKCGDDDGLFVYIFVTEGGVLSQLGTVRDPVFPVCLLCFGSLSNNAIVNCSPRTQDINREMVFGRSWYSIQEAFYGNGKVL